MKKLLASILIALATLSAVGVEYTITNNVIVVTNMYIREVHEITNKVKNTHTDYYFTNYVNTVNNHYDVTYRTNLTVNADMTLAALDRALALEELAGEAKGDAETARDEAYTHASRAAASATSASQSASSASSYLTRTVNAGDDAIKRINERITWFDTHAGETITQVNISTNIDMTVDVNYSYAYKSPAGETFSRIRVSPIAVSGDRYRITVPSPSSQGLADEVCIYTDNSSVDNSDSRAIQFLPAYIDSDQYGLRFQYIPDAESMAKLIYYRSTTASGTASTAYKDERVIPAYLYWQNGYWCYRVNVWKGGVVIRYSTWKYKDSDWPGASQYKTKTTSGSYSGNTMGSALSGTNERYNYGYSAAYSRAYIFQRNRTTGVSSTTFPESASASIAVALAFMQSAPTVYPNEYNASAGNTSTPTGTIVSPGTTIVIPSGGIPALPAN